jgi:hypothetical protein
MKKKFSKKHKYTPLCLISILFIIPAALFQTAATNSTSPGLQLVESLAPPPTTSESPQDQVDIGLWLVNVFDYQYTQGTYTADMYIYFFWTNPNIATIEWFFANGYPITPTSITVVANDTESDVKYEVYRATARLSSTPNAQDFPFDKINLTITVDIFPRGQNIKLRWLTDQSGLDSKFANSGWKTVAVELRSMSHSYPLDVKAPRAEMVVIQQRQQLTTSVNPFITPAIFALVCAVSFLFSLKEMSAVALRIGLNTSMLVTTLLFSFTISNTIPPSSTLVLYSIYLLSVLIFMVSNLIATIIGVVGWIKYKNEKRTQRANQLGFLISVIVPIVIFLLFYFLR